MAKDAECRSGADVPMAPEGAILESRKAGPSSADEQFGTRLGAWLRRD
jgi:hypothetical protein